MTRGQISPRQRHYVSFAGRGRRGRHNAAHLIPPEDRKLFRSRWNEFYKNGRPIFRKSCVVMAKARFANIDVIFWEFSRCNTGDHAEVKALQHVQEEEQRHYTAESVDLYLSYSPCTKCADVILEFSKSRPFCGFTVMFSCVFRGDDDVHRMGLRRLNASPDITLRVFTKRDWAVLAEATGNVFIISNLEREEWDVHWQTELDCILSSYEQENETRRPPESASTLRTDMNRNVPIHSGGTSANVVTPSWQRSIGRQTPTLWSTRQPLRRIQGRDFVDHMSQNSEAFNRAIQASLADQTRITVGQQENDTRRTPAAASTFGTERNRNLSIYSSGTSENLVTPSRQWSTGRHTPTLWSARQSLRTDVRDHVDHMSQNSEAFNRAIQANAAHETRITVGQEGESISRGKIQCTKKAKIVAFTLIAVAFLLLAIFLPLRLAS